MSNALAIAAVTTTLRNLVENGLENAGPGVHVITKPPDKARDDNQFPNRVNLFLYQTMPNAAWRNMDMPRQVKPGETGFPPLALSLYYLITAYSENDDEVKSNSLIGHAMSVLHDFPVLGTDKINELLLLDSGLRDQVERVRITPQPLSLEEISKLWTTFQTQFRFSAAYQVSVVLIESTRPAKMPLPVLKRGEEDRGATAQANLIPPFPTIEETRLVNPTTGALFAPNQRISFEINDKLALLGHHFAGDEGDQTKVTVTVRLTASRLAKPLDLVVPDTARTDKRIDVQIPNEPANYPAGVYTLAALVTPNGEPDKTRTTNEAPLLLAPKITSNLTSPVARTGVQDGLGDATLSLTCTPEVRPEQRVTLALGELEIPAQPHPEQTDSLTFIAKKISAGVFRVRLRVDGVDSLLIDRTDEKRPKFDESQKVTII
ncbi:MAG: DUF4255 domain-containing protein [bacterium]